MMSNQIKWQDVTSPPLNLFLATIMKALKQKNLNLVLTKESTPTKDVGTTVDKTTIQLNAELTNQMAKHDLTPLILFPTTIMKSSSKNPESCFDNRVNTHEGCWYHS